MGHKASLLRADPILFSPIYLNADNVSTEKLLALYRFSNIFFPKMGSGLVRTILDMERHGERLTANSSPEERRKLIRQMKSLNMDIQLTVSDEDQKIMEISIHIVPSEVLERAQQGRNDLVQYQRLSDDLDKLIAKLIAKEVCRRFTSKLAVGFKALTGQPAKLLFTTGGSDAVEVGIKLPRIGQQQCVDSVAAKVGCQ